MTNTQPESRSKFLRQRLVFYTSIVSIVAPVLTTIVPHFFFAAQAFWVLVGSLICSLGSAMNYVFFVRRGLVSTAATVQATVIFLTYSVSVVFSGGIYSQFLIFAPFMPVFGGFLTGVKGAILTTLYLVLFCVLITFYQHSLPGVAQTLDATDLTFLIQVVGAILSAGALTCIYETVTVRREEQLKAANLALQVAKDKLGESESLLKCVISNAPVLILVQDYTSDGRYSLINRVAEEYFGIETKELIGMRHQELLPDNMAASHLALDKKIFESGKTNYIDQEEICIQGALKTFRTWKVPTYDTAGNPHLMIRLSMDITDKLKLKKDLEHERAKSIKNAKLASLGEMSAGVAHEINNPLAIIVGSVRALPKFASDPEKLAKRIETIQKASERIAKIVKSLKKFSRSSEKSEHSIHPLNRIVDEAVTLTDAKAKRHLADVNVSIECEGLILCDEIEIEQVLVNLINNGIDAIKELQQRWVQIRLFQDSEQIILQVRDSGARIESDVESKMFQPFFTTKSVGEGTGLGLSIAKGILDEHRATIELDRTDEYTCFEIRFPKVEEGKHAV